MCDLLAYEYGLTPDRILKLTRRQISDLLDGLASRKSGYPDENSAVTIESNPTLDEKIKRMNEKRFGSNGG